MGPATPKLVAGYLEAPVRTAKAHWPDDTVEVRFDGEVRQVLAADADVLADPPATDAVRLLGAFDPWLQVRDRDLLVPDATQRKDLWRTLGRPGAVLDGHEVVGTWRPRSKAETLRLQVDGWGVSELPALEVEAERLAAHRNQRFGGFVGS